MLSLLNVIFIALRRTNQIAFISFVIWSQQKSHRGGMKFNEPLDRPRPPPSSLPSTSGGPSPMQSQLTVLRK